MHLLELPIRMKTIEGFEPDPRAFLASLLD